MNEYMRIEDIEQNFNHVKMLLKEYTKPVITFLQIDVCQEDVLKWYIGTLQSHLIAILLDNKALEIDEYILELLDVKDKIFKIGMFNIALHELQEISNEKKEKLLETLIQECMNGKCNDFLLSYGYYDALIEGNLFDKMLSLYSSIMLYVYAESYKELDVRQILSYSGVKVDSLLRKKYYKILEEAKTRIFVKDEIQTKISNYFKKSWLNEESCNLLNYVVDKNLCQSAIIHIEAEDGKTGTGFLITSTMNNN